MATDLSDLDNRLLDPKWYADEGFHEGYRRLRDEDPVHWTQDTFFGKNYWSLTRYDDVNEYLLNSRQLSSRWQTRVPRTPKRYTPEERYEMGLDVGISSLDDPYHSLYRRPMNVHFSVPAIARLTEDVNKIVDDLIVDVAERGECDLVDDIAGEMPLRVVFKMLGIPEEDWPELRLAAWQQGAAADPRYTIDNDPYKTFRFGLQKIAHYCIELAEKRRKEPQDDFATVIANQEVDGDKLSPHEVQWWFATIIRGGLETTRNSAAVGLWNFMRLPEQRALLLGDPTLMPSAIEEVLRWTTPAKNRLRIANDKMRVGGKEIAAGDWVVGFLASANKDERQFPDPHKFDITRSPNHHLSLGHGIHLCLGRNLARLELSVLFNKVLRVFPDLERTESGEPDWIQDASATGFVRMPLRFTPVPDARRQLQAS